MSKIYAATVCATAIAGGLFSLSLRANMTTATANDCVSMLGAWQQTHFGQDRGSGVVHEGGDAADLVIEKIGADCRFEARFDLAVKHRVAGVVGSNPQSGQMTIHRRNEAGCESEMFGTIYEIRRPVIGIGFDEGLAWRITSTDGRCGVPGNWYEDRWWHHR
jgi:hypothetical protein